MIYTRDPNIDQQKAIEIALSYLETQPDRVDYMTDVALIQDRGDYWECWFLKKKPASTADDIIAVNKVSGKASSWLRG